MPQPTPYSRQFDFTDFSGDFPSAQQRGDMIDAEFNAIDDTLDGVLTNLALIQRDDGKLKDGVVTLDAVDPALRQAIADATVGPIATAAAASASAAADSSVAANASAVGAAASKTAADADAVSANAAKVDAEAARDIAVVARTDAQAAAVAAQGIIDDAIADNAPTANVKTRSANKIGLLISTAIASLGRYATSRAALAANLVGAAPCYLSETGREGWFVFDASDLSAKVAIDTAQGIYVAKSTDATGASGAWVRRYSGPVSVRWFGAVADNVTNDGPAFLAALAYLKSVRITSTGVTYNEGAPTLLVPAGKYFLNATTLDLTVGLRIVGESLGELGGEATQLRWAANTPGIRVQTGLSVGDTGAYAGNANTNGGDASIIEKLGLIGPGGADAEYNAILMRARATIRDCYILNWQGDGIKIKAVAGGGAGTEGNSNNWEVSRCAIQGCRNGVFVDAADVNAGKATLVDVISNRQWGIWDSSFLGNTYDTCHAAGNGSGPYKTDDPSARNTIFSCYSESGQPPSSFVYPTLVIGGTHGAGITGVSWLNAEGGLRSTGNFNVDGNVVASGNACAFGPQTGAASDGNFYLDNTNVHSFLNFRKWAAGAPTTFAFIDGNANFGLYSTVANGLSHVFQIIGVGAPLVVNAAGITVTGSGGFSGAVTGSNLSGTNTGDQTITLTGDVTGSGTGSFAATIAAGAVTLGKMANLAANSIMGNNTGAAATPLALTAAQVKTLLGLSAIATSGSGADLTASSVTYAKLQNVSATAKLLGRASAGAGVVEELGLAGGLVISGTNLSLGDITPTSSTAAGAIKSTHATAGVGYGAGAGGAVTQLTSKSTAPPAINKASGQITMNNAALAAAAVVEFTVSNSAVAATDTINLNLASGAATSSAYRYWISAIAAGSFKVCVENRSAGSLSEALIFNFAIVKAVNA